MFDFENYELIDWIKLALSIIALVYFIIIYNRLVSLKQDVLEGFSNIQVTLKQRHDEIPKLVDTVKRYVKHEQNLFSELMQARKDVVKNTDNPKHASDLNIAENQLRGSLGRLFALAEDTPEIQANQNFLQLQTRLSQLESEISDRREYFNSCVNNNNTVRLQLPDIFVALLLGFGKYDLLEFDANEITDHNLDDLFKS